MNTYTVIGFYADNNGIWMQWVEAPNIQGAIAAACNRLRIANGIEEDPETVEMFQENCQIVGGFRGPRSEISQVEQVCNVKELLEAGVIGE